MVWCGVVVCNNDPSLESNQVQAGPSWMSEFRVCWSREERGEHRMVPNPTEPWGVPCGSLGAMLSNARCLKRWGLKLSPVGVSEPSPRALNEHISHDTNRTPPHRARSIDIHPIATHEWIRGLQFQ